MPNGQLGDVAKEIYPIHHRSIYSFSDGFTAHFYVGKTCVNAELLDVGGHALTGRDGKAKFKLSDFFCREKRTQILKFRNPVNFVATPYTPGKNVPTYLTITQKTITNGMEDIEITVNSWDKGGSPLANIAFNWRCAVPYSSIE